MKLTDKEKKELFDKLDSLTPAQQQLIKSAILGFGIPRKFWRDANSDLITQDMLDNLGNRLLSHHVHSSQPLSKDRFEFAFSEALNAASIKSELVKSRTNRGHDISINGVPVSLKTEAAKNIKENVIHISKWMELGKGEWVASS